MCAVEIIPGIKLSAFRKVLKDIQAKEGDLELWLSSDEEGNSFSPFLYKDLTTGIEKGRLILYPWKSYLAEEVF